MSQPQALDNSESQIAGQIWQLGQAAYTVEAALIGAKDFPPLARSAADIQASPSRYIGIIEDAELLAAAELEEGGEGLMISSFVVSPARFRSGLGTRLLQGILDSSGQQNIQVATATENVPAVRLYEKFGFEESSRSESGDGIEIVTLQLLRATSS